LRGGAGEAGVVTGDWVCAGLGRWLVGSEFLLRDGDGVGARAGLLIWAGWAFGKRSKGCPFVWGRASFCRRLL
jgi:hypothetical protein